MVCEVHWLESCSLPSTCISFQFKDASHGHVDVDMDVSIGSAAIASSFIFTLVSSSSGVTGVTAGEFEGAVDTPVKRYLLGRPLAKLGLYTHCAPWRTHLLQAPVSLLPARMHRSFWPWHRSHDWRLPFGVGAITCYVRAIKDKEDERERQARGARCSVK
jgi:hypothetical protein